MASREHLAAQLNCIEPPSTLRGERCVVPAKRSPVWRWIGCLILDQWFCLKGSVFEREFLGKGTTSRVVFGVQVRQRHRQAAVQGRRAVVTPGRVSAAEMRE